jgi:hypothetical protein
MPIFDLYKADGSFSRSCSAGSLLYAKIHFCAAMHKASIPTTWTIKERGEKRLTVGDRAVWMAPEPNDWWPIGTIVTIVEDDQTMSPYFCEGPDGAKHWISAKWLTPAPPQDEVPKILPPCMEEKLRLAEQHLEDARTVIAEKSRHIESLSGRIRTLEENAIEVANMIGADPGDIIGYTLRVKQELAEKTALLADEDRATEVKINLRIDRKGNITQF